MTYSGDRKLQLLKEQELNRAFFEAEPEIREINGLIDWRRFRDDNVTRITREDVAKDRNAAIIANPEGVARTIIADPGFVPVFVVHDEDDYAATMYRPLDPERSDDTLHIAMKLDGSYDANGNMNPVCLPRVIADHHYRTLEVSLVDARDRDMIGKLALNMANLLEDDLVDFDEIRFVAHDFSPWDDYGLAIHATEMLYATMATIQDQHKPLDRKALRPAFYSSSMTAQAMDFRGIDSREVACRVTNGILAAEDYISFFEANIAPRTKRRYEYPYGSRL